MVLTLYFLKCNINNCASMNWSMLKALILTHRFNKAVMADVLPPTVSTSYGNVEIQVTSNSYPEETHFFKLCCLHVTVNSVHLWAFLEFFKNTFYQASRRLEM